MKKNVKKLIASVLCMVMGVSTIGCSSQSSAPANTTEIAETSMAEESQTESETEREAEGETESKAETINLYFV